MISPNFGTCVFCGNSYSPKNPFTQVFQLFALYFSVVNLVATLIGVALNLAPPLQFNQCTVGKLLYQRQYLMMNMIMLWAVNSGPLVGYVVHSAPCNTCLVLAVNG